MAVRQGSLLNKFRGCLVGALVGDCLGFPFEGDRDVSESSIAELIDQLKSPSYQKGQVCCTDDSLMTWDIAESLIQKGQFDAADMAKRFCDTYYINEHSGRSYGHHVVDIFEKWKLESPTDPYAAAREQFRGQGSYGNGGAMRISPVALYAYEDYDTLMKVTRDCTLLTHTHKNGLNGAAMQAIAVWQALNWKQDNKADDATTEEPLDTQLFVEMMIERMAPLESPSSDGSSHEVSDVAQTYTAKLKLIKNYLGEDREISGKEIIKNLGHNVTALKSVPTALYCFLKCVGSSDDVPLGDRFEKAVCLAISLGGDTDTIASMAGSIAGAFYGIDHIPMHLQQHCEGLEKALELADQMYSLSCK